MRLLWLVSSKTVSSRMIQTSCVALVQCVLCRSQGIYLRYCYHSSIKKKQECFNSTDPSRSAAKLLHTHTHTHIHVHTRTDGRTCGAARYYIPALPTGSGIMIVFSTYERVVLCTERAAAVHDGDSRPALLRPVVVQDVPVQTTWMAGVGLGTWRGYDVHSYHDVHS